MVTLALFLIFYNSRFYFWLGEVKIVPIFFFFPPSKAIGSLGNFQIRLASLVVGEGGLAKSCRNSLLQFRIIK